jgi:cobalamin biosynthesis Co2+ chelatase CbiK
MTRPVTLIFALFCLLSPLSALADNHDEVTIRVMQIDEVTPDSVINRIELPVLEDGMAMDADMRAHEDNSFASEMDMRGFEAEVEVQGMQNEISNQGHGK